MRAILLCGAVVALVSASSAAQADIVRARFHFARPQTDAAQFRQDLRQCQIAAKRTSPNTSSSFRFGTNINVRAATYQRFGTKAVLATTSASALQDCMGARGYRLDPDGFDSGWMRMSV